MGQLSFNVHETIDPANQVDEAAPNISTATFVNLIPADRYNLGTQFFNRIGRKLRIRAFGKLTTAGGSPTPQFGILWGTGANNNGVVVAQSAAIVAAASTNLSWELEVYISCRSLGATGTLFCTGKFLANPSFIVSTSQPMMIPPSGAVVSAACGLTGTLIPSLQAATAGTGITPAVQDFEITPMS